MQTVTGTAATIGSPAIVARGLVKRFGSVRAVDDLSFEVVPGRVTGFVGPNGAGKSTTLRILLGLVEPDAGNAVLVSSHLLSEMAQMADDVIVIDHGRLRYQGSIADLTKAGDESLEDVFLEMTDEEGIR
jgi:ABC-type multidrug transport system ATPase subunit